MSQKPKQATHYLLLLITEHEPEAEAGNAHVSEEEARLHKAFHAGLELEVVYTVDKDENTRRTATKY
jgi:hypothetical protein